MQNQENLEKAFFEQLKAGDYVDSRYGDDDWKLAKVIQKQNKYLTLIYDGYPPNSEQAYINPMRIKPIRSVTTAYTGPVRGIYSVIPAIPDYNKHIEMLDILINSSEQSSPYKVTQFLRGQLFSSVNMLIMSDLKLMGQEVVVLNNFLIQLVDRIGKVCNKAKEFLPQYFQSNANNKLAYLANFKLAIIWSLQQLLYLLNSLLAQGGDQPRLLKTYKSELSQQNLYQNLKQYLPTLIELCSCNDINGRWLPTFTRIQISKILMKYKEQEKFLSITYNVKDYLEFYSYWPHIMNLCTSEALERKFVEYGAAVMCKQSPFDAKLKSLIMLRKILDKQHKLNVLTINQVIQILNSKKVVDYLLKNFNPQIFKRYIPILKQTSQVSKKALSQSQIDTIFTFLQTSHESQLNLIYEIIVSISQFISIETLDNIFIDIDKNIDINNQNGIKFVKDFTIKAIKNYNNSKSKGFLSSILGRKKNSGKFGYYGLDLFGREVMDNGGRIQSRNIGLVVANIGQIFRNQLFQHQRQNYMFICITNIDKKQSYGQSVKLLSEIICTYPQSAYIGQSQESVVSKLDDKYKLVDTLINGLRPLQKAWNVQVKSQSQGQVMNQKPGQKPIIIKVSFQQSIKYCYGFIQQFGSYLKYPLQLRHINHLWTMPHLFQFIRKPKQNLDRQIPSWRCKYYKKLSDENIKGILTQILKIDENIIPTQQCFDAVHQLILSANLNKSLQLTQRATIRYKNLSQIVGMQFYFKFLEKLILINKGDWQKGVVVEKNVKLVEKVIKVIFELHLRPNDYYAIESKCENWIKCLMRVVKAIYRENCQICVNSVQLFLQLIRGRLVKQINNAAGKLDTIVSYQSRQKTISLPKNSTILKLRLQIMQVFKIKTNFDMYNTHLKREIKYSEQQDFSIYAMGQATKGPTIILKKVQDKQLYPQFEACERFMTMIEVEEEFYKIIFGLLQKEDSNGLHSRIWKIIQKIPVNRATKDKIKNCKDFKKINWEQFLLPHRLEELQYSINIVYSLLGSNSWMEDFKKTQGNLVIQQLYLTMLGSNEPLSQKIKINLSKILLKILEHSYSADVKSQSNSSDKKQLKINLQQNYSKISMKLMEFLQRLTEKYEQQKNKSIQQRSQLPSIQCLNLMMKMLLASSLKKSCPQIQVLIKFFLHDQILLKLSDLILFKPKDIDTTFFTQDILQKLILNMNLQKSYKFEMLNKFMSKYLHYDILIAKQSTENYFIFLIDFLHSFDKEHAIRLFEDNQEMMKIVKGYVYQVLGCGSEEGEGEEKGEGGKRRKEPTDQMMHGCLKLLNDTLLYPSFAYDFQKIFNVLLTDNILIESSQKQKSDESQTNPKSIKTKLKYKKILYQIMKIMIYNKQSILKMFVDRMAPKLQTAEWRRNHFTSWNLQQQKKQKKYYCGLENLAATCYINCLFQQIFMIRNFTDRFINIDSMAYKELPEANEIYQFQKLLTFLKYGNKRSYTTRQFCQSFITYEGVPIDPSVQNDADQFFNALMEKIQNFLKMAGQHQILEQTFEGKLSNQLNCEGCPHSSQKIQPFLSIGLNIKNKKTLEQALDGYVQGQILDGDNAYYCELCEKKVRTMKRLCIKQLPNILVIVLKRFTFNFDQMRKIKINDELKFSQSINMKKYMSQFNRHPNQNQNINQMNMEENNNTINDDYYQYQLRGVVVHAGTSQGGHYYSFVKEEAGKWFEFNDQCIEEAEYRRIEEDAFGGEEKDSEFKLQKHKNAYILLYQKQIPNPPKTHLQPQQPFQSQLRQLVQSENRTADFMSIILDQNFIRLCENIGMCGQQKAHHFLILYFHSVLMRDKNRDEHLPNIYRIILTLISENLGLALWFLRQVDDQYIREFLIQAPKLGRYLALGLVIHAIKVVKDGVKVRKQKQIKKEKQVKAKIQPIVQQEQQGKKAEETKSQTAQSNNQQRAVKQENKEQQKEISVEQQQGQKIKNKKDDVEEQKQQKSTDESKENQPANKIKQENGFGQHQQIPIEQKVMLNQQIKNVQQNGNNNNSNDKQIVTMQMCNNAILDLIPRLVAVLKSKGMCPFAKIFTYLGSIPAYRQVLRSLNYPERVAQIVTGTNNQFFNKIQYPCPDPSYIGRQHNPTKQKDLQSNQAFLIESLRNFPHSLSSPSIQALLQAPQSRPSTKSLVYLLTKQTATSQHGIQIIETFKSVLMDDKYKREDIEKFMFVVRYYYLMCDSIVRNRGKNGVNSVGKENEDEEEFIETVKSMCLSALAMVIKANEMSYLLMDIVIVEINKLAYRCEDFRTRWLLKVSNNESLYKALMYWVNQSKRPNFLQRNQEWKRKTTNLSYQQKQQIILQNQATQQKRTLWMFHSCKVNKPNQQQKNKQKQKEKEKEKQKQKQKQKQEQKQLQKQAEKDKQLQSADVPEIHSELDFTEIGKDVVIGFRELKIIDRLGILTKVQDQKGLHRWAILERADVETYVDF